MTEVIKIGKLAQQAINKDFPDNWKALANMLNIEFEEIKNSSGDTLSIDLLFKNNGSLLISHDNNVQAELTLTKELIYQLIIEATKNDHIL